MTTAGTCSPDRHVQLARDVGALSELPIALDRACLSRSVRRRAWAQAAALVQELDGGDGGNGHQPRALRRHGSGRIRAAGQAETAALVDAAVDGRDACEARATGSRSQQWATAVLNNGLGDYADGDEPRPRAQPNTQGK